MKQVRRRSRVETGIYADCYGVSIYARIGGRQAERRYRPNTTIETLRREREALISELRSCTNMPGKQRRGGDAEEPLVRDSPIPSFRECYVYFVQDGDFVKIGKTIDIDARVGSFRTANARPLALLASTRTYEVVERMLHERFNHLRRAGEWFLLDNEIRGVIDRVNAGEDLAIIAGWLLPTDPPS